MSDDFKKSGANKMDQAYIKRRAKDGADAEVISREVKVKLPVVKSFMAHYAKPEKAAKRTVEKKEAD